MQTVEDQHVACTCVVQCTIAIARQGLLSCVVQRQSLQSQQPTVCCVHQLASLCRKHDASCLRDYVLLVDYVLSLQYFRLFRWDFTKHCLLDLSNDECMHRVLDATKVCEYLRGVQAVLSGTQFDTAKHILRAQISSKWIIDDHKHRGQSLKLTDQRDCPSAPGLSLPMLQLLLINKFEAERSRSTYLRHISDQQRNDAFNETDRIVAQLLGVQVEEGTHLP